MQNFLLLYAKIFWAKIIRLDSIMRNPAFLVTLVYCKYQFKQPWTKVHIPAVSNIYKGTPPIGIGSHTYKILTIGNYAKKRLMFRIWSGRWVAISQPPTALINLKAPRHKYFPCFLFPFLFSFPIFVVTLWQFYQE